MAQDQKSVVIDLLLLFWISNSFAEFVDLHTNINMYVFCANVSYYDIPGVVTSENKPSLSFLLLHIFLFFFEFFCFYFLLLLVRDRITYNHKIKI